MSLTMAVEVTSDSRNPVWNLRLRGDPGLGKGFGASVRFGGPDWGFCWV